MPEKFCGKFSASRTKIVSFLVAKNLIKVKILNNNPAEQRKNDLDIKFMREQIFGIWCKIFVI